MADFRFLKAGEKWVILASRRAKRPDVARGSEPVCPFCPETEGEEEVYRVSEIASSGLTSLTIPSNDNSDWAVRVLNNKFPFAPIHEVIIHSPDHHKNFGELPVGHVELILQTYRQRYQTHQLQGQVYIFHNRGKEGGESLPHPHSQLAVIPFEVEIDAPRLDSVIASDQVRLGQRGNLLNPQEIASSQAPRNDVFLTTHFSILCPQSSQWPDEVWIAPQSRGKEFGEITDEEIADLAYSINRIIQLLSARHTISHREVASGDRGDLVRLLRLLRLTLMIPRNDIETSESFAFNFYIYPGKDWYLRLIPRAKILGGFELGTGIYVNTQDPTETINFIREHFENPDREKIQAEHTAEYERRV